jgi:adenylosuccinate synthase
VNGLSALAVTKLDVLDSFEEIPIGVAYEMDDARCDELPSAVELLERVRPVYETLPGWQASTTDARRLSDLPGPARRYLDRLEALAGVPIRYVSVGTRREQIIDVES